MARKRTTEPTTCIGYLRVSKMNGRQVEDDATQTLKIQRERIEGKARSKGWRIVAWYQDLDASGGNTDRDGFQQALAAVGAEGQADVFCCAFLSRFSRNMTDTVVTEQRIREAGGSLAVCDMDIDTSTPIGRMQFNLMAAVDQYFLDEKTEQLNETRERAVGRGVAPFQAPLGYRKSEETRLFEIVEEEAEIVRLAFQMRADGAGCPAIARELNARGYRSRRGAGFSDRLVRNMLEVTAYVGDIANGDQVTREAHPAIVTRDVWRRAQTEASAPRALEANPSLLSGTARCATCSHSLIIQGDRKAGNLYYRCRQRHSAGRCPAPASIRMEVLDAYVEADYLASADQDREYVGAVIENDQAEAAIVAAKVELEMFLEEAQISVLGADLYNRQVAKRQAELDRALEDRRRSERSSLPHIGYREVGEVWPGLDIAARREVLHATLDGVFVQPSDRAHASTDPAGRVHVAPSGSVTIDLPRRGKLATIVPFVFPDDAPGVAGVLAA